MGRSHEFGSENSVRVFVLEKKTKAIQKLMLKVSLSRMALRHCFFFDEEDRTAELFEFLVDVYSESALKRRPSFPLNERFECGQHTANTLVR